MRIEEQEVTFDEVVKASLYETYYLEEADYPPGFDRSVFSSLNHKKRIDYIKQFLPKLGAGSSRVVFDLDNATVLKVAKNEKGMVQNATEAEVSRVFKPMCVAKVFDYDEQDHKWIEMEKAFKFKEKDFQSAFGISFQDFISVMEHWDWKRNGSRKTAFRGIQKPLVYDDFIETNFFMCLEQMISNYNMPIGDIIRKSSWGLVNRGGKSIPVLIDFGITQDAYDQYY